MTIGEQIKLLRKTMMINQKEFGKHLDISQTMISLYEIDDRLPIFKIRVKLNELAKKHKLKVNFLMLLL